MARLSRTSESSGGAGNGGHVVGSSGDHCDDSDGDDSLDPELEDELEERANNYGFTQDELNTLLSHGIKPWDDSDVDPWDFLEQLQAGGDTITVSNGSVSNEDEPKKKVADHKVVVVTASPAKKTTEFKVVENSGPNESADKK